ncbi:MAG: nitric oxide reductase F protein [Paracoccaceae bacterium]|nr:nitric oxide reductase F protein [Paracoccaceae bacterium]
MNIPPLTRAWTGLLVLSALSTLIAVAGGALTGTALTVSGALILTLAGAKARLILNAYLGLDAAPHWQRGFGQALALYLALMLGLYLIG